MKKIIQLSITFLTLALTACSSPEASFKITVIDETGKPIKDTKVRISFLQMFAKGPGQGWGTRTKSNAVTVTTDVKGICTAKGITDSTVPIFINKKGYYEGLAQQELKSYSKLRNRWEPWPCEVTVKLRKIKDPVPMCVMSVTSSFAVSKSNKAYGYDLKAGDWVAPAGRGHTNDFYVKETIKVDKSGLKHYIPSFSFPRKGDGMKEIELTKNSQSTFAWPYLAPEKGFLATMNMGDYSYGEASYGLTKTVTKSNFILRTRTKLDDTGNIVSAHYTRLSNFTYANGGIMFNYHFNPNNKSRSLEFNGKNSFKDRDQYGRKLMSR